MRCSLDYETRSECDLLAAGAYVYARHPTTRVLCCSYSIDNGPVDIWPAAAGGPMPAGLKQAMLDPGCEMHAWNAQFERLITRHVLKLDIPLHRWRCTAALARARGLPGKLEHALDFMAMGRSLAAKRKGAQVMLKWCRPLPGDPALGPQWADDEDEYIDLLLYCLDDTRSEMAIGRKLLALREWELAEYQLNELINDQGLPIDVKLAVAAQAYGAEEKQELNELLKYMTDSKITSTSQHQRIKDWLKARLAPDVFGQYFVKTVKQKDDEGNAHMVEKESTDKAARADFLNSQDGSDADPEVVEVIELVDDANKASVAKYAKIAARAADNGRAEGAYICWGAIQTKRYSSTGVQTHNFPRKGLDDVPKAIQQVLRHDVPGKVMHVLAGLLRPTIKASAGRVLVWGDWQQVEARGMPWLADCQWKLALYRTGTDVYTVNAKQIFGVEEVTDHQRQIGKVSELSLQFGGARGALRSMARGYGISLDNPQADSIVAAWRHANRWAMNFSTNLYQAFMRTALGTDTAVGPVAYRQIKPLLKGSVSIACDLPGNTTLYYHGIKGTVALDGARGLIEAKIGPTKAWPGLPVNPWETDVIFTKSMPGGFRIERLWHGLFAENVTQAVCAALLRDCLQRVHDALGRAELAASIVGHTHDEILLEATKQCADQAHRILQKEMVAVPKWLPGFPLGCEVKSGPRYVK